MNPIQAINTYLWVWLQTLKGLRRPVVILPFLLFAAVELALLWSSSHFYHKPWGYLWIPILTLYPGPGSLHYPSYFLALPGFAARLDLVLSALLGAITGGWAVLLFRQAFVGPDRPSGESLAVALRRAMPLIAIGVLGAVLAVALGTLLGLIGRSAFRGFLQGSPVRQFAVQFLLSVLLQALLVYVPVVVLLSERGLGGALKEGLGFVWRHKIMSMALVLVPYLLMVPLSLAVNNPVTLAVKFKPELVFTLCALNVVVSVLVGMLVTGATVRFFLYRMRQDRPAAAAPQGA